MTDGQPKQGEIPSERIEELAEQITREVCKLFCIPYRVFAEIKKGKEVRTMTSLKWSKGVYSVTISRGNEKHTEEFKKLSTALLFIQIAKGRI